jgi:hypothetical protein
MRLMMPALEKRMIAHPQMRIGEFLRNQSESPDPARQVSYKDVRVQMNYAKDKYRACPVRSGTALPNARPAGRLTERFFCQGVVRQRVDCSVFTRASTRR